MTSSIRKPVLQTKMKSKKSHHLIIFVITHKSNIFKKCNVGAMTRIILYRLEINNMRNMSMNLWPNLSYDTLKPFEGKMKKIKSNLMKNERMFVGQLIFIRYMCGIFD